MCKGCPCVQLHAGLVLRTHIVECIRHAGEHLNSIDPCAVWIFNGTIAVGYDLSVALVSVGS